jgi:HAD superfamily hydrolase (TIGR01490 family)
MKIAVFDVCGTLYDSNTTFDFLDDFFKNNNKYIRFRKITNNIFFVATNHYINKFFHVDLIRKCAISFLKGRSSKEVNLASSKFLTEILSDKKVNEVFKLLTHYRNEGFKIILMSASLDVIIKEIQVEVNANNYFSTQLEVINGKYTGKIKNDMTHKKANAFNENFDLVDELVVVTDNLSDLPLVSLATKKYIICWKQKHHDFWEDSTLEKIEWLDQF